MTMGPTYLTYPEPRKAMHCHCIQLRPYLRGVHGVRTPGNLSITQYIKIYILFIQFIILTEK